MAGSWSFQLYSARNFQPWDKILQTLGMVGYKEVEGFGGVYSDPAAFRKELDKNGLAMTSGHFAIDLLESDFDSAARTAETLGMKLIACPFLMPDQRPTDAAGWRAFGERLGKVGDKAKKAGFDFAWHNHDFEFKPLADGSVPQKHILDAAPDLGWEIDVAWVIRGDADPLKWIADYGPRINAVHVKDIAPAGAERRRGRLGRCRPRHRRLARADQDAEGEVESHDLCDGARQSQRLSRASHGARSATVNHF